MRRLEFSTKLLPIFLLCLSSLRVSAQEPEWVQKMLDPNVRFAETKAAFDAAWEGKAVTKGSGWKPYQRWAWYMEHRLTEDGFQSGPTQTLQHFQQYIEAHPREAGKRNGGTGSWTELGPVTMPANGTGQPNGMGRVNCITFHPTNANTFFVGAPGGGIWKTTDYGANWASLNNGLTRLGVSSIVIHPTNVDTLYIGTGDRDAGDSPGYGVWWTTDGGATWTARNTGMGNRTVNEILMDPGNPNILLAITNNVIYRSTDAGANWTTVFSGHNCKDIVFKPGDPNYVYASGTNLYRSIDNGVSWTQITAGVPSGVYRMALAVSANNANYVYLFVGDAGGFNGLYRSTDSGANFSTQSTTPNICGYDLGGGAGNQSWYNHVIIGDPTDANHITIGALNMWESFDGGANWSIISHWYGDGGYPAVHSDFHALEYSPHDGNLFAGNDGGVYYTSDGGTTWPEISSGLAIAQIYKIGQSQTVRDLVINGYQDNGTAYMLDGAFYTEVGGDGMECIVDYGDANTMYTALYYGDIRRSTNGGTTFAQIGANGVNGITEDGAWVTPYKLHPANPDTMFAGYVNIWRSFNCGSAAAGSVTWTQISSFGGASTIVDLAISPSNPDVAYVSRNGTSNFYKSTNINAGSPAWTDLEAMLPAAGTPLDIEIHPTNPDTLWIALSNKIYQSDNGGTSWTDFSGTLPAISLNTIVYDTASPVGAMYVGMDVGIYYRDKNMADWTLYDTGIPNVEITELEIYYDSVCRGNDVIRAATYGRGLWESVLKDPGNLAPEACFYASSETIFCEGTTVALNDYSTHNPTSWTWTVSPGTHSFTGGTNANSQNPVVELTAIGTYTVTLTAANAYGSDLKTRTSYITVVASANAIPATEDFETGALCGTSNDCGVTTCALPNGWENQANGSEDDIDFRLDENGTGSAGTGPAIDASPGTTTGNYIYTEASSCFGQTASMLSPCFDLGGGSNPAITFNYHMYGNDMGSLHLDIFADESWTNDIMTPVSGDQGNTWLSANISLASYAGKIVKFRFRGITGSGYESDIALDNIQVDAGLPLAAQDFKGVYQGNAVQLDWFTDADIAPAQIVIERSPDGQLYEPLAELMGEPSASEKQSYQYWDQNPYPITTYYQLKMIDGSGNSWYSERIRVSTWQEDDFWVSAAYPDPFTEEAQLDIRISQGQQVEVRMLSSLGQAMAVIHKGYLTPGKHTIMIKGKDLSAGIYHLIIRGEKMQVHRQILYVK